MSATENAAPAVPGPLNAAEMLEYKRLTALLDDNYDRRLRLALMKGALAKDAARLAAIVVREAELEAAGSAISRLRSHLHGRYKWPSIYRGSLATSQSSM